ncbi:MAG: hypothetical protein ABH830_04695 [Patescibacteria group bacterium]
MSEVDFVCGNEDLNKILGAFVVGFYFSGFKIVEYLFNVKIKTMYHEDSQKIILRVSGKNAEKVVGMFRKAVGGIEVPKPVLQTSYTLE